MKKMKDLPPHLKAMPIFVLVAIGGQLHIIDGEKMGTGVDIALLFSEETRARLYAKNYASLRQARVRETTIFGLIDHFQDRVEYFILNRPIIHQFSNNFSK